MYLVIAGKPVIIDMYTVTACYLGHYVGLLQGTGQPLAEVASSCLLAASIASKQFPRLATVPFRRNDRRYIP